MRKSKSAREVALQTLLRVEQEQAYSNLALQSELSGNRQLKQVDRAFVTEIVYGTMQRLHTIDTMLAKFLKQPLLKLDGEVRNLLRLSVYQLVFLDRVPAFAAINEAVEIAKLRNRRASGFVNGVLRNVHRAGSAVWDMQFPTREEQLAFASSHPLWLVRAWVKQYGFEQTEQICKANLERPKLCLRVNRLRLDQGECLQRLREKGVDATASDIVPEAILLKQGLDISTLPEFQEGLVTVQDESSMLVAYCLQPEAHMRVLDACAAPGGKTTHIAECMNDQGTVVACDIHPHKIELIEHGKARLQLSSVRTVVSDMRDLPTDTQYDRILLDAPCSGLGVLRRKPDIKWAKQARDIDELTLLQRDLLEHAAKLLNPGGVLVYSTCTLDKKENQHQILQFLENHPEYRLETVQPFLPESVRSYVAAEGWLEVLPHYFGGDGFFIARMRKISD
ncbi:16S rRNA (cytosine(967)-C(5))-methyltransferase RsmB [Fodinisporobacter ferrooxydans]|uniref:16S rRNA (cytosine(967)-C(5))-methyltransferase n=1 Tax=Fodinisporobacter ferrooxydans TaxID=2901836 RepID=A0ABY4CF90_9BACL|nr:16S rRNA (cytosine(967)-C(5))-methyltransferase RsmB [Alicyclobacillaceae bacterium MYW30-H2]